MLRPQHVEQKQPYVDDSCKLLLHFNGQSGTQQFIDSSNNPKVVTAYGNACLSNTHYRFGGTSGYFDGTEDYLTIPDSTDWNLENTSTISMWLNFISLPSDNIYYGILSQYTDTDNWNYFAFWKYASDGMYYFRFFSIIGGVTTYAQTTGNAFIPSPGTWMHVAIIGPKIYINGEEKANGNLNIGRVTAPLEIGRAKSTIPQSYSPIFIDELIIWKGITKPIGELYPQKRPYGYPIGGT